jgi:hypothetical protein
MSNYSKIHEVSMPENGRLYDLVAELIVEQRNTNNELKLLRQDFGLLRQDFNSRFEGLERRVERLEDEQKKTNVLLQQYSRDVLKIPNPACRTSLVHWGDKAQIGSGTKRISGPIVKVK